jgi:hypothetical protein
LEDLSARRPVLKKVELGKTLQERQAEAAAAAAAAALAAMSPAQRAAAVLRKQHEEEAARQRAASFTVGTYEFNVDPVTGKKTWGSRLDGARFRQKYLKYKTKYNNLKKQIE